MKNCIAVCIVILFLASCTKEGTGGDATLVVFLQHHTKPILSRPAYLDTVFVKFNSRELPGTQKNNFDTFFVGEAGEDHVHCKGLKPGDYYLYGAGFDTAINERVTGGMHVRIKHKERKDEIDVKLAISEP